MKALGRIFSLAGNGPRNERPSTTDWKRLSKELGRKMPDDFVQIVSELGTGRFGLDVQLFNPAARGWQKLSRKQLLKTYKLNEVLRENIDVPLFPESGGLITIAHVTTRTDLALRPGEDCVTMIDYEYGEVRDFNFGVSEFIVELYEGSQCEECLLELRRSIWCDESIPFFESRESFEEESELDG